MTLVAAATALTVFRVVRSRPGGSSHSKEYFSFYVDSDPEKYTGAEIRRTLANFDVDVRHLPSRKRTDRTVVEATDLKTAERAHKRVLNMSIRYAQPHLQ